MNLPSLVGCLQSRKGNQTVSYQPPHEIDDEFAKWMNEYEPLVVTLCQPLATESRVPVPARVCAI